MFHLQTIPCPIYLWQKLPRTSYLITLNKCDYFCRLSQVQILLYLSPHCAREREREREREERERRDRERRGREEIERERK
jgi:uncharacterized membrane protein